MVVARLSRLYDAANAPVDSASLRVFRALFGTLMVLASVRFYLHGWIDADYGVPKHFFHFWGLGWVRPLPLPAMYALYAVMTAAALFVAVGRWQRAAAAVFGATFSYAHLIDKSNYLNHYYLIGLIALLLTLAPLDRPGPARAWMLWLFRFQIAVVYVFGGIGKIGSDWLLEGEPLRIWLAANAELPILGRYFHRPETALVFSWGGLLFDLGIVPLILWRRTRAAAYVAVVGFHVTTALLFRIGMFPWIMIASATLFFDPSWPRRFWKPHDEDAEAPRIGPRGIGLALAYATFQIVFPLRHLLYPGNTLWTEEGFRFSWRVMLIEKSGELEFSVVDRDGHRTTVYPREYLTPFQVRMASTQPDMILELAHMIAKDQSAERPVQVFADAQVSFNGRMRVRMIDPETDLARESDGFAPKRWILPAPTTKPIF